MKPFPVIYSMRLPNGKPCYSPCRDPSLPLLDVLCGYPEYERKPEDELAVIHAALNRIVRAHAKG